MNEQTNADRSYILTRTDLGLLDDDLLAAHEFIERVTAWTGHEDDYAEAIGAIEDALARIPQECRS